MTKKKNPSWRVRNRGRMPACKNAPSASMMARNMVEMQAKQEKEAASR